MTLKFFKCNVGTIPINDCWKHCPRPEGRCLSLPTLHSIGNARVWNGNPSTTQCQNPTRLEYLKVKHDFAVDPFSQAFSLLGTRHHGRLEDVAKKIEGLESELKLKGEVSGILDLLEPLNNSGNYRLIDYKTFGSYPVAKLLGLKGDKEKESDKHKLALQLNNYRLMSQDVGFNVTEIKVQITVRDGNTKSAHINGVHENLYLLPVEILPDDEVREYFLTKAFNLCQAIEKDVMPEWCGYEDSWASKRCKSYCDVAKYCPEGAKLNKVELEG